MAGMWITGAQQVPKVDGKLIKQLMPVAFAHTVGHVTACVSFSMMAVSFAHIVKAAEPVFSVALSGPFLGTYFPPYVWASLIPIVVGCSLCAMKELSFAWGGFLFAMASNLGMVFRNILSKKCLTDVKDRNLDGINLFGLLSIISCVYCIPLAFVMESHMWPAMWETAVTSMGQGELLKLLALSGIFYHLYNQVLATLTRSQSFRMALWLPPISLNVVDCPAAAVLHGAGPGTVPHLVLSVQHNEARGGRG